MCFFHLEMYQEFHIESSLVVFCLQNIKVLLTNFNFKLFKILIKKGMQTSIILSSYIFHGIWKVALFLLLWVLLL